MAVEESPSVVALVSFCNTVASPQCSLAVVDVASGHLAEVDFDYNLEDYGATGISRMADATVIVALPGTRRLLKLTPQLAIMEQISDRAMEDLHSLAWHGDRLFAVATGRDSVLEFSILPEGLKPATAHDLTRSGEDNLHVNSLCYHEGRILVSTFGADWRSHPVGSPTGEIMDLEDRRVISASLRHPHSLVSHGGELYVIASYSGSVEQVLVDGQRTVRASYPGYLRGISFFDDGALVGVSGRRRRSRGLGTMNVEGPAFDERSGVLWFDHDWKLVKFVDLSWFGREIYDVLVLAGDVQIPSIEESLAAAKHRCLQLESTWEAPPEGPRKPSPAGQYLRE